jgi:predicted aspartyl protease
MLDTGFSGALSLPPSLVRLLDLPLQTTMPVTLAHGVRVTLRIFEAHVSWHGTQRPVSVHECDNMPLVGIGLIYGSRLVADILDGGELTLEPIRSSA